MPRHNLEELTRLKFVTIFIQVFTYQNLNRPSANKIAHITERFEFFSWLTVLTQ